jgi:AcrR family transcriptional regulator
MAGRREQILGAFRKRLHHYGYDKTTMAEIADDVGISVGSLYLEFRSKEDILAAVMEETAHGFETEFGRIAGSPEPAPVKLKRVLQARVELSDRCCREGAHSGEVLLAAPDRCTKMRNAKEARYLELLERILADGARAGELDVADPKVCAALLRDAISAYLPPQSLERDSEEVLRDAGRLIDLLVKGLIPQFQGV